MLRKIKNTHTSNYNFCYYHSDRELLTFDACYDCCNPAIYGYPNGTPIKCNSHVEANMIELEYKKCTLPYCDSIKYYNNYTECDELFCWKHRCESKKLSLKQVDFKNLLDSYFVEYVFNVTIHTCFYIRLKNCVLILDTDNKFTNDEIIQLANFYNKKTMVFVKYIACVYDFDLITLLSDISELVLINRLYFLEVSEKISPIYVIM